METTIPFLICKSCHEHATQGMTEAADNFADQASYLPEHVQD
jgi:hypothetical protein